jgi:hemerythrin superfamily protein
MSLVLNARRRFLGGSRHRITDRFDAARSRLGDGTDVVVRVAESAVKIAGRSRWPRLVGVAALGFIAGAAALGARKVAMQATTGFAGDWFATLKADHKLADTLFNLVLETRDDETGKRHLLMSKLVYALGKHQFEEEHVIYPALRNGGRAETPKHLDAEHFDMKTFMHELMELPKDDPVWLGKVRSLHKLLKEHVREEEEIVFPALHERLSEKENAHLSRAMHREGLKLA